MIDKQTPILLAEDDDIDAMSVERAFKELHIENPLVRVVNGEEALTYLRDGNNKHPLIILLDLNMPVMGGIELMKVLKSDEDLRKIPVVALTTSASDNDRIETFDLGIAGYIVKPVRDENFIEAIKKIHGYWLMSLYPSNY
jgi:CheY-like chemotaxis protein